MKISIIPITEETLPLLKGIDVESVSLPESYFVRCQGEDDEIPYAVVIDEDGLGKLMKDIIGEGFGVRLITMDLTSEDMVRLELTA
jgi:hypothetical protein